MTKPSSAERGAYYAEAETWSRDVYGALRDSRRLAWSVAAGAGLIAVLEAVALITLAPLKTVVPYTLTVDRQTGYVETISGLKPGLLSQNDAVTQAFLVQYVLARETYDVNDLQSAYRKVAIWSVGGARDAYLKAMATSNPQAPTKIYPRTTVLQTRIKSVSLLTPSSALVRFDVERRDGGADASERRPYAAVIAFRYTGAPMRMEDRFLNPLGFQVTSYRRDAETPAPVAAAQDAR